MTWDPILSTNSDCWKTGNNVIVVSNIVLNLGLNHWDCCPWLTPTIALKSNEPYGICLLKFGPGNVFSLFLTVSHRSREQCHSVKQIDTFLE